MICPYCGKENPENLDICEFCGGPLVATEATEEPYNPEPNITIIENAPQVEIPSPEPTVIPPPTPSGKSGNRIWWLVGCFVLVFVFLCCAVGTLIVSRYVRGLASFLPEQLVPTAANIPIETIPVAVIPPTTDPIVSVPTATNPSSSLPTSTTSPSSNQALLFSDDFSDSSSGWDRIDEADYYSDYYNSAYRIVVYTDMSDSWANPDSKVFSDVSIEVDATKNAGPDDNDFGVICRYQGVDQFYYAVISSDGFYGITKVTSDSSTILGSGEMQHSNYINQGAATNHIRFDCNGSALSLYVNGQQLDQQNDSEYSSGNVGLIAGTYDTAGTDIIFDNFNVLQP
jgi:hypothetical protein